jgi:hypothetical protein
LEIDGYRWAPCNLLSPDTNLLAPDKDYPPAKPTPNGLSVSGVGAIILDNVPLPSCRYGNIDLRFYLENSSQHYFILVASAFGKNWADMKEFWTGQCALLFHTIPRDRAEEFAALTVPVAPPTTTTKPVEDDGNQVLSARYLCLVSIWTEKLWYEKHTGTPEVGFLDVSQAHTVEASQRWCIF